MIMAILMKTINHFIIKALRHAYLEVFGPPSYHPIPLCSIEDGNSLLIQILSDDKPCMIARYGANELNCILNYIEIIYGEHNVWKNITGKSHDWWWNEGMKKNMFDVAGFFPITEKNLSKFSELMLEDSKNIDALAIFPSIYRNISKMTPYLPNETRYFPLLSFDSFLMDNPWTSFLSGKRVLIVHPFAELIERQYDKRKYLFENSKVLPDFDLITLKAVQSIGGVNDQGFTNWFAGLEWMKSEMNQIEYDVALIGCGAYGYPLAAHAKRTGHKAVHVGGSLQLLFGIKGKRWENPEFGTKDGLPIGTYSKLMDNPNWIRPEQYKTKQSQYAEGACYW